MNTPGKGVGIKKEYIWLCAAIFLILGAGLGYLGYEYNKVKGELDDLSSSPLVQEEKLVTETLEKLAKHAILPEGQLPSIAEIQDVDTLKEGNLFYADAKNGNLLIVYQTKAFIYDTENDLIVNIGPVFLQSPETTEEK